MIVFQIMRKRKLTTPQLAFIAGTRVALGAGIGLLIAKNLKDKQRNIVGRSLIALGAASTIPAAKWVFGR